MERWGLLPAELRPLAHVVCRIPHIVDIVAAYGSILLVMILAEIFIAFFYRKQNLTAFVSQLVAFLAIAVFIVHLSFCLLSVLYIEVINKGMRPESVIGFRLLHPDGPDASVLLEHRLKSCLIWQLQTDWESYE